MKTIRNDPINILSENFIFSSLEVQKLKLPLITGSNEHIG